MIRRQLNKQALFNRPLTRLAVWLAYRTTHLQMQWSRYCFSAWQEIVAAPNESSQLSQYRIAREWLGTGLYFASTRPFERFPLLNRLADELMLRVDWDDVAATILLDYFDEMRGSGAFE